MIIDNQSLQAYRFSRAGVNAHAAIDAVVRVYLRFAIDHADRTARALAHTAFTPRALLLTHFGRHLITLSKTATNHAGKDEMIPPDPGNTIENSEIRRAGTPKAKSGSPTHGMHREFPLGMVTKSYGFGLILALCLSS